MCRLLAYKGAPIILDKLLYQPKNSLIHQSYDAKELEEPLNGDGFGIGWYQPQLSTTPAVFVSVHPAWSNRNLRTMAPKIEAPVIFAHVRAASFGETSEANCHPFFYDRFLMMHNGSIEGFDQIKREMRRGLSDEVYAWLRGGTDSEHFFALFIDKMLKHNGLYGIQAMVSAMQQTITEVEALKKAQGVKDGTYLNMVVTDGKYMIGTRFVTTEEEPLSLYVSEGSRYECEDGICRMVPADAKEHAVLVVSEKLTGLREDWKKIPANHFFLVDDESKVSFQPIVA